MPNIVRIFISIQFFSTISTRINGTKKCFTRNCSLQPRFTLLMQTKFISIIQLSHVLKIYTQIRQRNRSNNCGFGQKYGRWLIACVIGCFLLGPSIASDQFNDGVVVYGTTGNFWLKDHQYTATYRKEIFSDPLVLNCTAPKIMTRKDWLAMPPRKPLDKLALPIPKVIIAHTATETCKTQVS